MPKRKCQANIHDKSHPNDDQTGDQTRFINLSKTAKILKREDVRLLLDRGIIKEERGHICEHCLNNAIPNNQYISQRKRPTFNNYHDDKSLPGTSRCHTFIPPDLNKLLDSDIQRDTAELFKEGRPSLDQLVSYNAKEWLEDRPSTMIELLTSMCGMKKESLYDDKKAYKLAKAVEQIYHIRNSQLILPISFREAILLYSFTYSKQAVSLFCKTAPSSSYRTINRFLSEESSEPVPVPEGCVRIAFDNNQVIGKTYTIKGDNKVPSSVMTSTSYVQTNGSNQIQKNEELKPEKWMYNELSPEQEAELLGLQDKESMIDVFHKTRNKHIDHYLKLVEHQLNSENLDYVDQQIKEENEVFEEKVCIDCGSATDSCYRYCRVCGGSLHKENAPDVKPKATKAEDTSSPLAFKRDIPIRENNAEVRPGEPDLVNPNSFETIITVMRGIGRNAGVYKYGGNDRAWLFLECDGLPYKMVRDICDNVFLCERCGVSFYGKDKFESEDHRCILLDREACCASYTREFDWVVPVVGLLHLEMNIARSFISLNWDVFVSRLAFIVGFESERAQLYCKKGSDHHKLFDLLEIFYMALTEELLVGFVKQSRENNTEVTVQAYWDWSENLKNPNYNYVQQMVFTYLHAIMLFRTGVRHNDVISLQAGMLRFAPLFYARHHPKYQDILYRDLRDQVTMPPELKETLYEAFTFSRTRRPGHYQGGDANLEEINKEAKKHVSSSGIPTDKNWQQVFRNLPKMEKVRESTMKNIGLKEDDSRQTSGKKLSPKAVGRVRVALRRSGYLSDPKNEQTHKDIDNKTDLNPNLEDFASTAKQMRLEYLRDRVKGNDRQSAIIAVTSEENEHVSGIYSKTVKTIHEIIVKAIDQLPHDLANLMEDDYKKNYKRKARKGELIEFYRRILEEIENADDDDGLGENEDDGLSESA